MPHLAKPHVNNISVLVDRPLLQFSYLPECSQDQRIDQMLQFQFEFYANCKRESDAECFARLFTQLSFSGDYKVLCCGAEMFLSIQNTYQRVNYWPSSKQTHSPRKSRTRETDNLSTGMDSNIDIKQILLSKAKFSQKQTFFCQAILHPVIEKVFKSEAAFFFTFPKNSESQNFLDIRLWEVGAKRHLNNTSKVIRRTDVRKH